MDIQPRMAQPSSPFLCGRPSPDSRNQPLGALSSCVLFGPPWLGEPPTLPPEPGLSLSLEGARTTHFYLVSAQTRGTPLSTKRSAMECIDCRCPSYTLLTMHRGLPNFSKLALSPRQPSSWASSEPFMGPSSVLDRHPPSPSHTGPYPVIR